MPIIETKLHIKAPIERCFDLARSIDLHQISTSKTREKAVAGVTYGLIRKGESVTWRANHFGMRQSLTVEITAFDRPNYFVDEMVKGTFKRFRHEHRFKKVENGTSMIDIFDYTSPFGWLGDIFDFLILKRYMRRFLRVRNQVIKEYAESELWKDILNL